MWWQQALRWLWVEARASEMQLSSVVSLFHLSSREQYQYTSVTVAGLLRCWIFLNKGMIAPILAGEEGEQPGSCGLHGGLSIVRMKEEFDNVCGLPQLPP